MRHLRLRTVPLRRSRHRPRCLRQRLQYGSSATTAAGGRHRDDAAATTAAAPTTDGDDAAYGGGPRRPPPPPARPRRGPTVAVARHSVGKVLVDDSGHDAVPVHQGQPEHQRVHR